MEIDQLPTIAEAAQLAVRIKPAARGVVNAG
jgi:hypothetical protein